MLYLVMMLVLLGEKEFILWWLTCVGSHPFQLAAVAEVLALMSIFC